jgi:hypothetical protein
MAFTVLICFRTFTTLHQLLGLCSLELDVTGGVFLFVALRCINGFKTLFQNFLEVQYESYRN